LNIENPPQASVALTDSGRVLSDEADEGFTKERPKLWRRLAQNRMVVLGGIGFLSMVLAVGLAVILSPHDPLAQDLSVRLLPPFWAENGSLTYPLGTDALGRDILSRLLFGGQISLILGTMGVLVAAMFGILVGLVAGYYGKWIDDLLMRVADVQLAFPVLIVAIAMVAVIGRSMVALVLVLGISQWVVYARTIRASVLSLKQQEFAEASIALGAGDFRVIFSHILPNAFAPIIVIATVQLAQLIILESGLSFFGLGTQPPTPSWGGMLAEGREYMIYGAWWVATLPGLAISITVLSINLLGDGLRDVLDPQLRIVQQ
jgi:ABC-type dipeptide/oligopeptide/nickel transport system permease subunit